LFFDPTVNVRTCHHIGVVFILPGTRGGFQGGFEPTAAYLARQYLLYEARPLTGRDGAAQIIHYGLGDIQVHSFFYSAHGVNPLH
jgi:hypothetical protein